MSKTLGILTAGVLAAAVAGCSVASQPKMEEASAPRNVMDVQPTRKDPAARFTAPQWVAPPDEPTVSVAAAPPLATTTPVAAHSRWAGLKAATAAGDKSTYTVRKGDTLYRIAKTEYGDGKKWITIASANPGLSPQTLKTGQTIVIP